MLLSDSWLLPDSADLATELKDMLRKVMLYAAFGRNMPPIVAQLRELEASQQGDEAARNWRRDCMREMLDCWIVFVPVMGAFAALVWAFQASMLESLWLALIGEFLNGRVLIAPVVMWAGLFLAGRSTRHGGHLRWVVGVQAVLVASSLLYMLLVISAFTALALGSR
uniref:Uncharacterized protein n=1 Tax=viral metagenome TaxID=1070528 RepID=A0A6H1ZIK0_9ZZZZ